MLAPLLSLLLAGSAEWHGDYLPGPGRAWGPEQALGAPDVLRPNTDDPHAWAPLLQDKGEEWLELTFERPVRVAEIHVFESLSGGFVTRIVAPRERSEVTLWAGQDRTAPGGELSAHADPQAETNRIRIYLDTRHSRGWEEIDAVQLVGADGSRQWARSAKASSTYAEPAVPPDPYAGLVGQRATVHLTSGATLAGEVKALGQGALRLEEGERVWVISQASVAYIEWGRQ